MDPLQQYKLSGLFTEALTGKAGLNYNNAKQLSEAISSQEDSGIRVQRPNASVTGLEYLQVATASHTSPCFLNGNLNSFVRYLQAPEIMDTCDRSLVQQINHHDC